jgi:hypothetical protein
MTFAQDVEFSWAKAMGSSMQDAAYEMVVDDFGNVYTTGIFSQTADFDPGPSVQNMVSNGSYDMFITKLDAAGNLIWTKQIGGTLQDESRAIAIDPLGNLYITGLFQDTIDFDPGPGNYELIAAEADVFICKLDSDGNFIWAKQFKATEFGSNYGLSIKVDEIGSIFTAGQFGGELDFDPGAGVTNLVSEGASDGFISKLDSNGDFLWVKQIAGPGFNPIMSLNLDDSGNILTTGFFQETTDFDPGTSVFNLSSAGSNDIFICKLDPDGNFVWAKQFGGVGQDDGNSLITDSSGNVYTVGLFNGTVDFDPGPGIQDLSSMGSYDAFVSKLDSAGSFLWVKQIGGAHTQTASSIAMDTLGDLYVTGYFSGTTDFDPGSGVYNLSASGGGTVTVDAYISKLTENGDYLWAKNFGQFGNERPTSIVVDESRNIYTSGYFSGLSDFDPDAGTYIIPGVGSVDVFVSKLEFVCNLNASAVSSHPVCYGDSSGSAAISTVGGTGAISYSWPLIGGNGNTVGDLPSGSYSCVVSDLSSCNDTVTFEIIDPDEIWNTQSITLCYGEFLAVGNNNYSTDGVYVDTLLTSNGCDSILTTTLSVENPIDVSTTSLGQSMFANFVASAYQWIDCANNQPIAGEINQSFLASLDGDYAVIVYDGSCSDTSACISVTTAGIEESNRSVLEIYPNPVSSMLYVFLKGPSEVSIIDLTGKLILQETLSGAENAIDVERLVAGVYLLQAGNQVRRFIKK